MRKILTLAVVLALAGTSAAQSPNTNRSFVGGANHHLGDEAFLAEYGRPPTEADEKLRIRTHFLAVQKLLLARPATKPELASKRAAILAHFADYIAKGTTPKNAHLPWRTPVFIDDEGTICAVGYLIEQTAGRSVAEKVASGHRYSYLEEIAKDLPEVKQWVEQSGLTLEELASIQPGYPGPEVAHESGWTLADKSVPDGAYDKDRVTGVIKHHHMEGTWKVADAEGHLVGTGVFHRGSAAWKSTFADGKKLAVGSYKHDAPTGEWKFYHPSGNLAAEGRLAKGTREGRWRFFYDSPAHTPIATGSFEHGYTVGTWRHFDNEGGLLAVSHATRADGEFLLDVKPGRDGVGHQISQQGFTGDHHRLDMVSSGSEHLYVQEGVDRIYDKGGNQLVHEGSAWMATECGWDRDRKRAAKSGRVSDLRELIMNDRFDDKKPGCDGTRVQLSADRAKLVDKMLASVRAVRAQSPDFMRKVALGEADVDDAVDPDADAAPEPTPAQDADPDPLGQGQVDDLSKVLAASMTWYVEFPHVDGKFAAVYATLAGLHQVDPY